MNDRELLELAAKAAGYGFSWKGIDRDIPETIEKGTWNPLAFDGDALRLAVKLNISIGRPVEGDSVQHWGTYADDHTQKLQVKERDCGDAVAATRRAIVKIAAEIGKAMP